MGEKLAEPVSTIATRHEPGLGENLHRFLWFSKEGRLLLQALSLSHSVGSCLFPLSTFDLVQLSE